MNEDEYNNLTKITDELYSQEKPPRIISTTTRYEVMKRQNWKCNQCNIQLKFKKDSMYGIKIGHIDHIHPYADAHTYPNGKWNINESINLQALCQECNLKKGKKKQ